MSRTINIKTALRTAMRRCVFFVLALSLTLIPSVDVYATERVYSPQTQGISDTATQMINDKPYYSASCNPSASLATGGAETELTFPRGIDDGAAADAINKYIEENKSSEGSILEGIGEVAVQSAKNANVNPFLIIAQSKHESGLGSKSDYNVKNGNNSFGRMATSSQPNFSGSRLWYKWSSGEASVDYKASENVDRKSGDQYSYVREMYSDELDAGDWGAYFEKYAPLADGNSNNIYHPSDGSKPLVQQAVEEMAAAAGGSGGGSSSSSAAGNDQCCTASTTGEISGDTPVAKVMSYLTGKGLSIEIAAGFAGNFMQESGGGTFELDPEATNGTHNGIAQWDRPGRYAKLVSLKGAEEAKTLDAQIWYVGYELGLESDEGSGGYKDALDYIKQADTAEDAAKRVDEKYEVSGGSALDKRIEFANEALDTYGDGAITPASGGSGSSCGSTASGDFVYYDQNDPKWQNDGMGIALAGCGPTSIAMIIASKKDKEVTPVMVAKFLKDKGMWAEAGGIQWTGFGAAGEEWGMQVTDIGTDWSKAKEALKAGKFMTLSGTGSAPFTSGGHIIVARGITDDDKIIIANSAPMNDTPEETPYTTAELDGAGFRNMWVYE